jgi:hypothetical protein
MRLESYLLVCFISSAYTMFKLVEIYISLFLVNWRSTLISLEKFPNRLELILLPKHVIGSTLRTRSIYRGTSVCTRCTSYTFYKQSTTTTVGARFQEYICIYSKSMTRHTRYHNFRVSQLLRFTHSYSNLLLITLITHNYS